MTQGKIKVDILFWGQGFTKYKIWRDGLKGNYKTCNWIYMH